MYLIIQITALSANDEAVTWRRYAVNETKKSYTITPGYSKKQDMYVMIAVLHTILQLR